MEIKEEILNEYQLEKVFAFDKKEIKKGFNKVLKKIKKTVFIPGFRKGKIPTIILKKRFGQEINAEVFKYFLEENIEKELKDLGDKYIFLLAPEYDFEIEKLDENSDFEFKINLSIIPDNLSFHKVDNFDLTKKEIHIKDDELENAINYYKSMYSDYLKAEEGHKVEKYDHIKFKFECFNLMTNSEEKINENYEEFWFKLNVPKQESILKGAESYFLNLTYNSKICFDHFQQGKYIRNYITIIDINRPDYLSDEEFCEKQNVESIDQFRDSIRKSLEMVHLNQSKQEFTKKLDAYISDTFKKNHSIPESLIEKLMSYNEDVENKSPKSVYENHLISLIFLKLVSKEQNLEVDQDEIKEYVKYTYHKEIEDESELSHYEMDLLKMKVYDYVYENIEYENNEVENDSNSNGDRTD